MFNINKLKQLRKERKLTQRKLDEELGFTKGCICQLENEVYAATFDKIVKIARYFNVSIDEFVKEVE